MSSLDLEPHLISRYLVQSRQTPFHSNPFSRTFSFNMRSVIFVLLQAASLASALSRADVTQAEAEALCGDLGVMEVPEGVDASTVRACKEHPTFTGSPNPALEKRKCWYGQAVGCDRGGWCYRTCDNGGTGAWCWTTKGGPLGEWKSCGRDSDCSREDSCGGGGCKKCGCGC
jgi:hypothetical protein